jgi:hypothetical protein
MRRVIDVADTDRATLIRHLLEGQYSSPVCIVAFNTAEGWSRDVTAIRLPPFSRGAYSNPAPA